MNLKERTCCFFGHRKLDETDEFVSRLNEVLEKLIVEKKIDTFLFGSKSEFDKLCLKVVTVLKKKYPHIKRIYDKVYKVVYKALERYKEDHRQIVARAMIGMININVADINYIRTTIL